MLIGSDADLGRALSGYVRADGAQSSRVLVPLPDDPYVAVRQTQLVDTYSKPEEAPSETEDLQSLGSRVPFMGEEFEAFEPICTRTDSSYSSASSDSTTPLSPDHPLTHVSPTPTPTRVSFHRRTARMAVRTQPTLSPGMSVRIAEATALSPSSFCKRESQGLDDEGYGLGDEDHGLDDGSQGLEDEGLGLEEEEAVLKERQGAERVSAFRQPTIVTWVDPEDDRVYIDIPACVPLYAFVQTPPSPEWSLRSLPVSPSSPVRLDALPLTLVADIDRDMREMYTRSGVVRDEIFSQRYMFRSLEREHEKTTVTFGVLWRPVLALEAWAGHVDTRLADTSRDRYDDHRLIRDMLVQQAAMQRELQEMRGRVAALEHERGRR
uniref:Uncharacterized protein n=1 Tax=Tanacetum cinerariifolium TaxID=118510 RepID=A0A6L2JYY5_TANCI|nr:hypothetical protein [Tanacetum cinerariifolium]